MTCVKLPVVMRTRKEDISNMPIIFITFIVILYLLTYFFNPNWL